MSVISTENQRLSNLVKREHGEDTAYCREVVTYNGAAKTFKIGDLVTSVGGVPAAAANIYGIVLEDKSAPLNTNTKLLVMFRGPATVSKFGLTLGALVAADTYAKLETMGIQVLDAV